MTPSPRMRISPSLSSFAFDAVDDAVEVRERARPRASTIATASRLCVAQPEMPARDFGAHTLFWDFGVYQGGGGLATRA